ncbi:hypothetical protein E0500_042355 [Streptomyces sp. KM273126]|nr:hypothetical protein [Streptomyces sp. KM273126]
MADRIRSGNRPGTASGTGIRRAEKSRSRRTGGSGLDLSIVRRLVEAHKGTVSVTSAPGTQTVFTLRLPADR